MGPNGLVPSIFLYGIIHTFLGPSKTNIGQKERFEAPEMELIVAK